MRYLKVLRCFSTQRPPDYTLSTIAMRCLLKVLGCFSAQRPPDYTLSTVPFDHISS
jgi:hypothetical protein